MAKYQVVTPDDTLMSAYQSVICGKPDCWDIVSQHDTLADAEDAANKIRGRVRIRLSDDINPNHSISDKYYISPKLEPELSNRIAQEWDD